MAGAAAGHGPALLIRDGFCTKPCSAVPALPALGPVLRNNFIFVLLVLCFCEALVSCPFSSVPCVAAVPFTPLPAASPSFLSPAWLPLLLLLPTEGDILGQGSDAQISWGK